MDADPAELSAYDFDLPQRAIAQSPTERREDARMLVLDRASDASKDFDARVAELPEWLAPNDLLVVNRTRVVPARLRGRKRSGGRTEALLLEPELALAANADSPLRMRALLRHRGRLRAGTEIDFEDASQQRAPLRALVAQVFDEGEVALEFEPGSTPYAYGEPPLPPYIRRANGEEPFDRERYQTVFADADGAIAAPTAGLHLTHDLLARAASRGIEIASVILHVGVGTFRPLRHRDLEAKRLHRERYVLPRETEDAIARTRARGGRVVAVGTTTTRVLETRASERAPGCVCAGEGETDLFLAPGDRFRVVDVLLTNFHLPRSSLLLLVCAFAGRERVLAAYARAIDAGYRFYSYGDAMLVL